MLSLPTSSHQLKHFIFGYGSLICQHSRALTAPSIAKKTATPVLVRGIERIWSKRAQKSGMTAMGVRFQTDTRCVGVLLPVNLQELARFDKREVGYDRVPLDLNQVHMVPFLNEAIHYSHPDHEIFLSAKHDQESSPRTGSIMTPGSGSGRTSTSTKTPTMIQIWVYVQRQPIPPSRDYPIAQTYVDTILRGCLSISEEFAKEFISTTKGWNPMELPELMEALEDDDAMMTKENDDDDGRNVWVNDRNYPLYNRGDPKHSQENSVLFDSLLQSIRPGQLSRRVCRRRQDSRRI